MRFVDCVCAVSGWRVWWVALCEWLACVVGVRCEWLACVVGGDEVEWWWRGGSGDEGGGCGGERSEVEVGELWAWKEI